MLLFPSSSPFDDLSTIPPQKVVCLRAGLLTVLNALPEGALNGVVDEHSGYGEGQEGILEEAHEGSDWNPVLRDFWLLHVASATSCQVPKQLNI